MRVAVIGTGYVGLVVGLNLAKYNDVICVDIDQVKIDQLSSGKLTIYEADLDNLLHDNLQRQSIKFTTDYKYAIDNSSICFVTVGTPFLSSKDTLIGETDTSYLKSVMTTLKKCLSDRDYYLVLKSTVTVGTTEWIKDYMGSHVKVVYCPEFLREGMANYDFNHPDRVVLGGDDIDAINLVMSIYREFPNISEDVFLCTDSRSAELIKLAANSYLATKISLINEIANISTLLNTNLTDVIRGLESDVRIGNKFMSPGVGYGGSCFSKDIRNLINIAYSKNYKPLMLEATETLNEIQKTLLVDKLDSLLADRNLSVDVAILGVAFKDGTDDTRNSPAIPTIRRLVQSDYVNEVRVYDSRVQNCFSHSKVKQALSVMEAVTGSSVIMIMNDSVEFKSIDLNSIISLMNPSLHILMDGRNIFLNKDTTGFDYYHI